MSKPQFKVERNQLKILYEKLFNYTIISYLISGALCVIFFTHPHIAFIAIIIGTLTYSLGVLSVNLYRYINSKCKIYNLKKRINELINKTKVNLEDTREIESLNDEIQKLKKLTFRRYILNSVNIKNLLSTLAGGITLLIFHNIALANLCIIGGMIAASIILKSHDLGYYFYYKWKKYKCKDINSQEYKRYQSKLKEYHWKNKILDAKTTLDLLTGIASLLIGFSLHNFNLGTFVYYITKSIGSIFLTFYEIYRKLYDKIELLQNNSFYNKINLLILYIKHKQSIRKEIIKSILDPYNLLSTISGFLGVTGISVYGINDKGVTYAVIFSKISTLASAILHICTYTWKIYKHKQRTSKTVTESDIENKITLIELFKQEDIAKKNQLFQNKISKYTKKTDETVTITPIQNDKDITECKDMIKQCHHDIQSSSHDTTHTEQKLYKKSKNVHLKL